MPKTEPARSVAEAPSRRRPRTKAATRAPATARPKHRARAAASARKPLNATVRVNRAPVLTLWAAVVAERLGHDPDEAMSLGKAVAVLNARSKGRRLGLIEAPTDAKQKESGAAERRPAVRPKTVDFLGRSILVTQTKQGIRAVLGEETVAAHTARRYVERAFGESLPAVRKAMDDLAAGLTTGQLAGSAYDLYERFRPSVPQGKAGWGARGELDLNLIRSLARSK